jgi:hypothetical protein
MLAPEPPHNAGYLVAAYIVAPVILVGYLGMLWRRVVKVGRTDGRADGRTESS